MGRRIRADFLIRKVRSICASDQYWYFDFKRASSYSFFSLSAFSRSSRTTSYTFFSAQCLTSKKRRSKSQKPATTRIRNSVKGMDTVLMVSGQNVRSVWKYTNKYTVYDYCMAFVRFLQNLKSVCKTMNVLYNTGILLSHTILGHMDTRSLPLAPVIAVTCIKLYK